MLLRAYISIILAVSLFSCDAEDKAVFNDDSNYESKPQSLITNNADQAALENQQKSDVKKAAEVTYRLKISGESGAVLCRGQIALTLMTNFSLQFPNAFVKCSSMTIDLASLLSSSISGDASGDSGALSGYEGKKGGNVPISHDGKVLYFKEIAGATFEPARPFLIGPIITDAEKYRDFELNVQSNATTTDGKNGSGSFKMKVLDHKMTYSNSYLEENGHNPFENVIHWELLTSGFDGFTAKDGVIIERFIWHWNTRPLMIPEIQIEGDLGDLFGPTGPDDDGMASAFVGYVKVNLKVEKYEAYD
jgi:hypothetical protein